MPAKSPSLRPLIFFAVFFVSLASCLLPLSISAQTHSDWPMAGANPQRTSWVTEEVRGGLNVEWYQAIEPYIPYKIQPVFYNGVAYVSTSKGLYAFDLTSSVGTGGTRVKWVYPTELPLGHSPTIATVTVGTTTKVVAYVGGFDRKIHAVDVSNGQALSGYTPFEAQAGFETNPLVIKDSYTSNTSLILSGSKDGKFYGLNAVTGAKVWEFQTQGPIQFSAAYKNGVVYFASNDLYAYALRVSDGNQVWRSQKFQYSAGFHSYWPIIYTEKNTGVDYVVYSGATNYRSRENNTTINYLDSQYFIPGCMQLPGPACPQNILWNTSTANNDPYFLNGTTLMDVNGNSSVPGITSYYETYPDRRYVFVLKAIDGTEYTFDSNGNGIAEYAPFTWAGTTAAGNKYPGLVNGIDNIFYQNTLYYGSEWISRSDPVGWKFGSHYVSRVSGGHHAMDEPIAYSGGGKVIYWELCCDREAGAFDVTLPLSTSGRSWTYISYNLIDKAPDFHPMYHDGDATRYNDMDGWHTFSGKNQSKNGVYGKHGITQSPPVPYQGKLYMLKGNTLLAWKASVSSPTKLSLAPITTVQKPLTPPSVTVLKQRLELEVQKMIIAGHLRPGYYVSGLFNNLSTNYSNWMTLGETLDYFSNPSETVYTLLLAYPHLSSSLQTQVKTYLQNNYGPGKTYDITTIQHVGWGSGASREFSTIPPETFANMINKNPSSWRPCCAGGSWNFSPLNFYAAWKYAQIVGNNDPALARTIFNSISGKVEAPAPDSFLIEKPYFTNMYAAGYHGYLQLKLLAGLGGDTTVQGYYNKVLGLRTTNFTKDTPYWPDTTWCGATNNCANYQRAFSVARNFAFLTPEIASYMKQHVSSQVQTAVNEYQYVAPYWFVSKFDNTIGEGTMHHLYDSSLILAKAYILGQPYTELVKYLDSPAFAVGDLFYLQNLVAVIQAPQDPNYTPPPTQPIASPTPINYSLDNDTDIDILDILTLISRFTQNLVGDFNQNGRIDIFDFNTLISKL